MYNEIWFTILFPAFSVGEFNADVRFLHRRPPNHRRQQTGRPGIFSGSEHRKPEYYAHGLVLLGRMVNAKRIK